MHATLTLQAADYLQQEDATLQPLSRAAFSLAIFLSIWGAAKISWGITSPQSRVFALIGNVSGPMEPFRGMSSIATPLLLTVGTLVIFGAESVVQHDDWARAIVTGGAWLPIGIALWTFVWVYLKLQIGLHRLGRRRLSLEPYPGDRSLAFDRWGRLPSLGSGHSLARSRR